MSKKQNIILVTMTLKRSITWSPFFVSPAHRFLLDHERHTCATSGAFIRCIKPGCPVWTHPGSCRAIPRYVWDVQRGMCKRNVRIDANMTYVPTLSAGEILRPYLTHPPVERHGRDAPKCLELFARNLLPGWTAWGNDVIKFQQVGVGVAMGHP